MSGRVLDLCAPTMRKSAASFTSAVGCTTACCSVGASFTHCALFVRKEHLSTLKKIEKLEK